MKTATVWGMVVAAHVVVVGGLALISGCGTPTTPMPPTQDPTLPGPVVADQPQSKPFAKPVDLDRPAPVPAPAVASKPAKAWAPESTTTYIVRKGDALSSIAKHYGLSTRDIVALNGLKSANQLQVGQKLLLPGKHNVDASKPPFITHKTAPKASATTTKRAAATAAPAAAGGEYVVKSGDMLSKIAQRHGTTTQKLRDANGLKSDRLSVGQKLKLPGAAPAAVAAKVPAPEVLEPAPVVKPAPAVAAPDTLAPPVSNPPVDPAVVPAPVTGAGAAVTPAPAVDVKPAAATTFETHTVKEGEDLYSVAIWWGVQAEELKKANNLTDSKLTPGQVLKIPMPAQ